ncbi:AAL031Wp [Eremothecium gossypii ATCC 10895]|uniref:Protein FYV6 n=1 Tax=Eremothecium gossypii (strain ATCC 10895 / CBS 109.51 / FGSC 9923 / NRRL Y-1056) TaxID=284811 RepID=FYV6_EREGS|nr:AAL031Wp [Eremothecium gossypii ATCC 10895]Q75EV9.1 RecName: Full=Protein FYV6 [Eremothecium gossypii ATCC 10895]AAS50335.1 AAL031Wp [Eremothecium gossypii ATCC 10895]AEY94621.1 FAAL031Wp [Eremothecium gossypii FDAG1]
MDPLDVEDEVDESDTTSLQAQLRQNAIRKQEQFQQEIQERNSMVNRMSAEALQYFNQLHKAECSKKEELQTYIDENLKVFEKKQKRAQAPTKNNERSSSTHAALEEHKAASVTKKKLGIVKKGAPRKTKIRLPVRKSPN